jgi:hypothetical protein
MNTETLLPPLALALGRLRQPRAVAPRPWPYAPQAEGARVKAVPLHDFLVIAPADALRGNDNTGNRTPDFTPAIPGPEAARTYWFDL